MNNQTLIDAIQSASIHKKVANYVKSTIKPNMTLREIAIMIENMINSETKYDLNNPLKAGIAFPVGLSLNNCAAHYTPNYNEKDIILKDTDILKIDYGVHKNGVIIDSAFTISFNPVYEEFINISKNLTDYAVSLCAPDAVLGDIGALIEEYTTSKEIIIDNKTYSLKTMRDLSGHAISTYEIHAGKAVPNTRIHYPVRMKEYEYYAIEPFLTNGNGKSLFYKDSENSHFMFKMNYKNIFKNIFKNNVVNFTKDDIDKFNAISLKYDTLPFCQRWLYESNICDTSFLFKLEKHGLLNVYPPIYDIKNSIISQFEHTIFIKENGVIKLT
jgi:methionyl aminopeptidase